MKKVLAVVLTLVLVLSLTACSGANIDGSWKIVSMTEDGKDSFEGFDLKAFEAKGVYLGIKCKDGKATMDIMGEVTEFTYDGKTFSGKNEEGKTESIEYTVNGDTLKLTNDNVVMTFKKMTDAEAKAFDAQDSDAVMNALMEIYLSALGSDD